MNIFQYLGGEREAFDPRVAADRLASCILCHRPVVVVGVFNPHADEGRAAVLRLRNHAIRAFSDPAIGYGLCRKHGIRPNTSRIEAAIVALAERVTVQ